jgi:multiple sugar transport system permease protein
MSKKMTFKQFLFILPLLVLVCIFAVYPVATTLFYGFFEYKTNEQQHNKFYLTEYLNTDLFVENCEYVNYFLSAELSVLPEEGRTEAAAIQKLVMERAQSYGEEESKTRISREQEKEIKDFIEKINERTDNLYKSYPEAEFINKERMPQIVDSMESCLIGSNFTGINNYKNLFTDLRFYKALGNTAFFTVVSVSLELVLGMLLALIMNKALKGIGIVRTVALIPWAIPTAVSAIMWRYLYDGSYGVVSMLLTKAGIISSQSDIFASSSHALGTIIFADVWKTVPYMALLLLAGLQTIDGGLFESASIDGAGAVKSFFKITLPLMKSSILVALLFRTLDAFRVYDLITVLTGGGPGNGTESLSIYAYKLMFGQSNYGYGSVVVMGMFLCVAAIAFVFVKVLGTDLMGND